MNGLITFALRRRGLTIALVLAAVVGGALALTRLPFDAYPDLTGTRVDVATVAPGMSPEDVERLVTYPIESSLMGLPGAGNVRSVSKFGLSLVTVPFEDGTDLYVARTLVQQRLADAKELLPAGVEPAMGPLATPMGEIYQYVVVSDSMSPTALKTLHDYVIRPRLRTVPGVADVNSWGGLTEQIQVVADPARLAARGLTLADLHRALADNNLAFGGSYLETGGERYTVRGLGRLERPADIARIGITAPGGGVVTVGDVATVTSGALPRHGAVTHDGRGEVVSGMILKRIGADSRRVVAGVEERLKEIQTSLPRGVRIVPFYDQTDLVRRTTRTVITNLIEGGLLVITVLFLFLRNVRASVIVASVIPLSMLIAFGGMYLFGYSGNLMSLGALDFGLIVDASVVMVENFVHRLERAHPDVAPTERERILRNAAIEVGRPVLFGIAIIVAVYLPIFTLRGMEGHMFRPMAFTVVCAVLASLVLALTYVPAVSMLALKHRAAAPPRWFEALRGRYSRGLDRVLARPHIVVGAAAVAIVAALVSLRYIGTEFMPKLDEGTILVNTRRLPSVSLPDANAMSTQAERILLRFPEVRMVVTKEGRPDLATEAMGLFEGDLYVMLRPRNEWRTARDRDGLIAAFDSALAQVPGLSVSYTQPLAMRLDEAESGIRTDLGIKVVGPDLATNARVAERIRRVVAATPGSADVAVEVAEGSAQVRLAIDRDALARYGMSVADVQRSVDLAMGARAATELIDGPRRVGIAVRFPDAARRDADALSALTIRAPSGAIVPLSAVASVTTGTGPELIAHEDAQRRSLVLSNVRGRDLGGFVQDVRARIASAVPIPAGVFLEWGGQYENQQRAMERLRIAVPLALVLIAMLLFASFGSVAQAALVILNVPFALVGGIAALWLRGLNLSLSASVGFIALFGIAVLNGIVLVSHVNSLRKSGLSVDDAVRQGALDRLRPVLMTALVASLGFIPMAVSTSAGAEVQRPLATVVIGGLVTSTVLTLFVLPVLYRTLARRTPAAVSPSSRSHAA